MADAIEFKITGAEELQRKLEELPRKAAAQIVRRECAAAVTPWREEMVARVRRGWHVWQHTILRDRRSKQTAEGGRTRDFGVIASNIQIRTKVNADELSGSAQVFPNKKAFWARFLEFGTSRQRTFPFIRPAFESQKTTVLGRFVQGIRNAIKAAGLPLSS